MDANYARAYALLSNTYTSTWVNPWDADFLNPAIFDQAHELARKAVQLDLNLSEAHGALGTVLIWKHQHDASIAEFERAVALNPNYSDWRFGLALVYAGNPRRAISEVVEAYMRLDPFYGPLAAAAAGFAHYMLKEYPEALRMLHDYVSRAPNFLSGHARLAATYAQLGQFGEARAEAAEVLRLHPAWTIEASGKPLSPFKFPQEAEHYFDGLRKAGLPER
jgi:tetratricopeptide (TPR) repeat protein